MKRAAFLGGAVFGCVLGLGVMAQAALGGADGLVIPYRGHLDQGGSPVNGAVTLGFDVFNTETGGAPCSSSVVSNVPVVNGDFQVAFTVSPQSCVVGQPVYLGMRVHAGTAQQVTLQSRQRIYPTLGAYTAGRGDFSVTGNVDVASAPRTGIHPQDRPLYVTGALGAASGVEFRQSDGTQGVGIGSTTVYATGSTANQDLNLSARGTGVVRSQSAVVAPSMTVANRWRFADTGDDWLRINDVNGGAYYGGVAAGRLYSAGDITAAGKVIRSEYVMSCPAGLSGTHFPYCCRIHTGSGVANCRITTSTMYASWVDISSPFPTAGSDAPYSITCNMWVPNVNFPVCCRMGGSGASQCAINTATGLGGAWAATPAPF